MSNLASLLNMDQGEGGLEVWLFDHARDHDILITAAQKATGINYQRYILGAVFGKNMQDWLLDHQKAHDDLVSATGVIGNDLQDVDFNDEKQRAAWLQLDWQEHNAFHEALGV